MQEKVFMFGLDKAGKTVISRYLSEGIIETNTKPSIAFKQHVLTLTKLEVVLWDTPGQIKYRKSWIKNVGESKVLIFILDTSDSNRFPEARQEFDDFIKSCYNLRAPVIFCFHQMDKPEAQGNFEKANEVFELDKDRVLKVIALKTTIKDSKSLDVLRDKVQNLL
nr:ADP-ribosylation factor-like protein [Candidatus Sigynarchaeota archaeon]